LLASGHYKCNVSNCSVLKSRLSTGVPYSTRLVTWRNQGQQVLALAYENMDKAGAVDVYIVYILNGETFSLVRNAQGQLTSVSGIAAWQVNASLSSEISELISLPISGNINIDVYVATLSTGTPVESLDFKTLQLLTALRI
jgi:hypothetical protein